MPSDAENDHDTDSTATNGGESAGDVTFSDIEKAAEILKGNIIRTPCVPAPRLSAQTGCDITLKLENLQHTGSFKVRGALIMLDSLSKAQAKKGVVACSAGNHAQGVAFHAQRLGIPATIVMPKPTPFTKVESTKALDAKVVLHGDTFDDAKAHADHLVETKGLTMIPPFDHPLIIAGQGTMGIEILNAAPDLDTLVVPIGGGGMISGIAIAAKHINPKIEIVGVQTAFYPSMKHAIEGTFSPNSGATLAEGIAVKEPGLITRKYVARLVDRIDVVSEKMIERAVHQLLSVEKQVAEGAGAAGLAAIISNPRLFEGRKVGIVVSGANIDNRLLSSLLLRGLVEDGRLVRLRMEINDQPGSLARVSSLIGEAGANIIEVFHQRLLHDVPLKMAELDIVIETRDKNHVAEVVEMLNKHGYVTRLMSEIS